ncbi:MAG: peptidylprolyl isomerase [Gammaproteobacteria bacterium]|nr:peptidylprolyl isomerase [Gammaproteobacteria bacterium]
MTIKSKLSILGMIIGMTAGLTSAPSYAEKTIATVNGTSLYQSDIDSYIREQNMGADEAQDRSRIIDGLISRELVHQDALAKGLHKDAEIKKELANIKLRVLVNASVRQHLEKNPITEKQMRAEYEERIGSISPQEYKARHILVKTEKEANELIKKLDKGSKFEELAEKHSTGPSGPNGGDLGWFGLEQMVPPFAMATQALDKGKHSKKPVETQFGWHIIKLEDTRKAAPPSFEDVKSNISSMLQ